MKIKLSIIRVFLSSMAATIFATDTNSFAIRCRRARFRSKISEYAGGNMPNGGYNITTACQYYDNLRIASRVFSVLGQASQSDKYWQQLEAHKAGIIKCLIGAGSYQFCETP